VSGGLEATRPSRKWPTEREEFPQGLKPDFASL
jgi:hypothetical protein